MTTPRAAIVIGSGFGGAAAATRLAEAGWQVTLLERGPWRDSVPVRSMGIERRSPFPQGRRLWRYLLRNVGGGLLPGRGLRLNPRGMFEIHFSRGLRIVCSAGVGGGSHAYAGLNVRPPDPAWWDDVDPALSSARMEAHYEHVLGRMGSRQPMADDRLPNTLEERFRDSAAIAAGGVDYELGMGFLFPETPGAPRKVVDEHGVERFEARPGEDGNLGSEGGGKTTLDFAFLAPAMRAGLTVRDQCEVKAISREGDGYSVAFVDHHDGATGTISAPRVIVAAGTLNTLRLLLHSEKAGGLAPMPRLGEGFGGNGDFFGYWKLDDAERDLTQSMPAHGPLRLPEAEPLGPGRDWPMVVEGALPPPAALPLGGWVARMLRSGTFVAGMGPDAQDGRVRYDGKRLSIDYEPARSEIFGRILDAFRLIGERSGRRIFHFKTPITVHPTGGACIGPHAGAGVVDASGEVFGNPGLYVADAAALPKPVGGPPSITIAAWGDHVATGIVAAAE